MDLVIDNLRLAELVAIVRQNESFFDAFVQFLVQHGYKDILVPVKTRETMGGGHANLFTRDIHKAISVAQENGYGCIPGVIAESWGGNLESLSCKHVIYLPINPNQTERVEVMLYDAINRIALSLKELEK